MSPAAPDVPAAPVAISLRGLTRKFGELTAVDGISFEVQPGELFGLVGPDGAGKTTTLRMLAGVMRPTSGDAFIGGVSVVKDPEGVKHRIAYMSQRFGLYTDLTVRENIDFYADLYQVPPADRPARIERLYRFSDLGAFEDRLAGKLSGGMKQKLSLCCALIHHPEILLLDEPTFGVDPISRRDLWLILHEMVAEGVTVLVTTAYMDEAERCDHVALINRGKIIALDRPAALQKSLDGEMVTLRASDGRKALELLRAAPQVRRAALFGATVHVTLASRVRDWPAVAARLRTAGIDALDVQDSTPSLEDVFIERVPSPLSPLPFPERGTAPSGSRLGVASPSPRRGEGTGVRVTKAVEVSGLTRMFGEFVAVDHVTFDVDEGEIFGFLGPNGAGKTTTIKMLTGLLAPSAGDGRVAGLDIRTQVERIKQKIGYMSQLFSLYGDLTVNENIAFFAGLYEVEGERLEQRRDWVLEMSGLAAHRTQITGELPLGWKQRLALGCAVLHEPPILFLDEPTSGVDPVSRRNFWDLIYALAHRGTTIFVSTHYMEEAEYCHRLALMNRGKLIALDRPATLRSQMSEPILELATDNGPAAAQALQGAPGVIEAAMFGRAVHVVVDDAAGATATLPAFLRARGLTLHDVSPVRPSLEDVFVSLVRREGGAVAG